jgi:hypothetical protein
MPWVFAIPKTPKNLKELLSRRYDWKAAVNNWLRVLTEKAAFRPDYQQCMKVRIGMRRNGWSVELIALYTNVLVVVFPKVSGAFFVLFFEDNK